MSLEEKRSWADPISKNKNKKKSKKDQNYMQDWKKPQCSLDDFLAKRIQKRKVEKEEERSEKNEKVSK